MLLGRHSLAQPHRGLYWFARPALRRACTIIGFSVGLPPSSPGRIQRSLRKGLLPAGPSSPAGSIRLEFSRVRFSFSCHVFQAFPGEACSETTLLEGAAGGCLRAAPIPRGLLFIKKKKKKNRKLFSKLISAIALRFLWNIVILTSFLSKSLRFCGIQKKSY